MGGITDENAKILAAQGGDRGAMDWLIERHHRAAWRIALKVYGPCAGQADIEDAVQEGLMGLMRAVEHFDPNRGAKLITFAWRLIMQDIIKYRRREQKREEKLCSMFDVLADRQDPIDPLVAAEEKAALDKQRAFLHREIGQLDARRQKIFSARLKSQTMRTIGKRHGITASRVQQIISRKIAEMQHC